MRVSTKSNVSVSLINCPPLYSPYLGFHCTQVPYRQFANSGSVEFSRWVCRQKSTDGAACELHSLRTASNRHYPITHDESQLLVITTGGQYLNHALYHNFEQSKKYYKVLVAE